WYREQWGLMNRTLESAVEKDSHAEKPQPPLEATQPLSVAGNQQNEAGPAQDYRRSSASLKFCPVVAQLPAGPFAGVGYETEPLGYLQIDRVTVDKKPYAIRTLRSTDNVVSLTADRDYVVVKIRGDSMNKAGIDDGDYVIISAQPDANHRDIVVAEIDAEDSQATLKRMLKRNGKVILQPESSNREHRAWEFASLDQGFSIRGVALAVLKPL
ncbi:MAG: hypothetical protein EHM70_08635, partial [Chloroflexota bacterium]